MYNIYYLLKDITQDYIFKILKYYRGSQYVHTCTLYIYITDP